MIDKLGRKERAFFCNVCHEHAIHVLINNIWYGCCCDPLLTPNETLIGFTIGEVINLRGTLGGTNGQK